MDQNEIGKTGCGCGCSGGVNNKIVIDKEKLPEWASNIIETPGGQVIQVLTEWNWSDYWGQIKSRISSFRMEYMVKPGLYAVGTPTKDSDIFVSANYKLSFDILRRELKGINGWILVLDTNGINVWCAAGKGTFGTDELIARINSTKISLLVDHRRIIVPQLGAVGINADAIKKATGFRVYYGPVRAIDIPAYLAENYKATEEMRIVKFTLLDRLILTPIEFNSLMKPFLKFIIIALIIGGIQPSGFLFADIVSNSLPIILLGIVAVFSGAFITPVFLPFIPFRSFALKGLVSGSILVFLTLHFLGMHNSNNIIFAAFSYIFFPAVSSYLALQFTGATTYTNISGVKKELKIGMPIYKVAFILSVILLIGYKIEQWGLI